MFGELWIDDPAQVAARRSTVDGSLRANFEEFLDRGYTIFRAVVDEPTVDRVRGDLEAFEAFPERYVLKNQGKYIDPAGHGPLRLADRIVDLYAVSAAARAAIYPAPVAAFLRLIFGEAPLGMQSISFAYGSQQAIHQDTAYVISEKPLSLAASWLALQDVVEGTGELTYYPGSHRFEHYLFSGEYKNWTPARDGQPAHQAFLSQLHAQARARNIEPERFIARKGDVLVWHADLAHGGAPITRPGVTRHSLVTHFCPRSVKPAYRRHIPQQYFEYETRPGCFLSSRHYDMRVLASGKPHAPIIYDAGVSKSRVAGRS